MEPLTRIEDKLDRVAESLATFQGRLDAMDEAVKDVRAEVKPLRDHLQQLRGMGALLAFLMAALEALHIWG